MIFTGISLALSACFIWGLIFIVPQFMSNFNSIEVVIGRYFFYGALSVLLLLKARLKGLCSYPLSVWIKAFFLSFLAGYYLWILLGIRYTSPEICALILGISPITIAFYGNWKEKEGNFNQLVLPSFLILVGLIMINAPHIMLTDSSFDYIIGLSCSIISLLSWSAYVVLNSRYLKSNPSINSNDWATILGFATLLWTIVGCLICCACMWGELDLQRYFVWNQDTLKFYGGCAILGLLCSWVGGALWNKASVYLPVSLAGQLMIFETIFGILFVYILKQEFPTPLESGGILLLLGSVAYGIRALSVQPAKA